MTRLMQLPAYTIEVRRISHSSETGKRLELMLREFPFADERSARAEFDQMLKAGADAYASGNWRLVLLDHNAGKPRKRRERGA